jgi:hypothetical protein
MRVVPVALSLAVLAGPIAAQTLHYEGSAGLATGTYIFPERTSSWNVTTGVAFGVGPVTVRVSLPVFYQNTTLLAATGSGYVPTGGSSSGAVADSSAQRGGRDGSRRLSVVSPAFDAVLADGDPVSVPTSAVTGYQWAMGDPLVSATVFGMHGRRFGLGLAATVKVPVVDTASFGTGAWDVGGTVSASVAVSPRVMLALDGGYWHLGDPPDLDLSDPVLVGGTLSVLAGGGWGLSAGATAATPTIEGFATMASITFGLLRLTGAGSVGLLGSVGLTETAPDVSASLTWRVGLLR